MSLIYNFRRLQNWLEFIAFRGQFNGNQLYSLQTSFIGDFSKWERATTTMHLRDKLVTTEVTILLCHATWSIREGLGCIGLHVLQLFSSSCKFTNYPEKHRLFAHAVVRSQDRQLYANCITLSLRKIRKNQKKKLSRTCDSWSCINLGKWLFLHVWIGFERLQLERRYSYYKVDHMYIIYTSMFIWIFSI